MPIPNPLLCAAYRFSSTSNSVSVTLDGGTESRAFATVSLYEDYFLVDDTQSSNSLCKLLKDAIEGHSGGVVVDVYIDPTDWLLKIDILSGGTTLTVDWSTATFDPEAFGAFPEAPAAASTISGDYVSPYIWRPDRPVTFDGGSKKVYVGGTSVAMSGLSRSTSMLSADSSPARRSLNWELLPASTVIEKDQQGLSSFESFWNLSCGVGRKFAFYEDEGNLSPTERKIMRALTMSAPWQRNGQFPVRWDISFEAMEEPPETGAMRSLVSTNDSQYYMDFDTVLGESGAISEATIVLWIRNDTDANDNVLGEWESNEHTFRLYKITTHRLLFYVATSGTDNATYVQTDAGVLSTSWHHVALTFDSGTAKIWVDGQDATNGGIGTVPSTIRSSSSRFGIASLGGGINGGAQATLDDVAIYERALTQAEINTVRLGKPTDVSGCKHWFTLDGSPACSITGERGTLGDHDIWSSDERT